MAWFLLLLGGLFEMGWAVGLKLADTLPARWMGWLLAAASMALSLTLLYLAQRTIPIGTAYAVWTGIGAVGTFILGIVLFGEEANFWRLFSALLVIAGLVGLKLSS